MKPTDEITFANMLVASGIYNNNVNLTLATFRFTPTADGKVDPDPVVTANLRIDLGCARQIRDRLTDLLTSVERTQAVPAQAQNPAVNGHDRPVDEVLN